VRDRAAALYAAGGIAKKDLDAAQFELDSTLAEMNKYTSEASVSVIQSITSLERNVTELDASITSAENVLTAYDGKGYSEKLVTEKYKLDMLASIADTLFSLQTNVDALNRDLNNVSLSMSDAKVISPIDGVVTMYTELSAGDYIQAGLEIATIIPSVDGDYKIMIAVPNGDIGDISVGQEVKYRFDALPYNEYGELRGTITSISTDARSNDNGASYYLVEANLNGTTLHNKAGEPAQVKVGMTAEVRVITKQRKIIFWVLEKLNFID
jgi:HlyD family secretion protein